MRDVIIYISLFLCVCVRARVSQNINDERERERRYALLFMLCAVFRVRVRFFRFFLSSCFKNSVFVALGLSGHSNLKTAVSFRPKKTQKWTLFHASKRGREESNQVPSMSSSFRARSS